MITFVKILRSETDLEAVPSLLAVGVFNSGPVTLVNASSQSFLRVEVSQ